MSGGCSSRPGPQPRQVRRQRAPPPGPVRIPIADDAARPSAAPPATTSRTRSLPRSPRLRSASRRNAHPTPASRAARPYLRGQPGPEQLVRDGAGANKSSSTTPTTRTGSPAWASSLTPCAEAPAAVVRSGRRPDRAALDDLATAAAAPPVRPVRAETAPGGTPAGARRTRSWTRSEPGLPGPRSGAGADCDGCGRGGRRPTAARPSSPGTSRSMLVHEDSRGRAGRLARGGRRHRRGLTWRGSTRGGPCLFTRTSCSRPWPTPSRFGCSP